MLRVAFRKLSQNLTPEQLDTPEAKLLIEATDAAAFNIVQLVYHSPTYEGESKDYEFSRQTMEDHWRTGYEDAQHTLSHKEVLQLPDDPAGVAVYDFTGPVHEGVRTDDRAGWTGEPDRNIMGTTSRDSPRPAPCFLLLSRPKRPVWPRGSCMRSTPTSPAGPPPSPSR
jgi:hypothetical protein